MSILEKLKEIKDGWGNYVFPNPEVEAIANQRAIICSACTENKMGICGKCGCVLAAKCRNLKSKCPKALW